MKKLYLVIATGLGLGFAPVASGTFGTLLGIPTVWLIGSFLPAYGLFIASAFVLAIGVKASNVAEEHYGKSDDGRIVIDEVLGYMATMYLIPVSWQALVWAFFIFRFFDIVKPWPARMIDTGMKGGWGVMLDDLAAGVYSCAVMHILLAAGVI
jgi:phosphatidylglycerophosphatase A